MKIREIAKSESRYPVKPPKGSVGVNGAGVVSTSGLVVGFHVSAD
jgi:hypothetical protein